MGELALIYHDNCPDGFGAAFSFWKKYKQDILYFPMSHSSDIPDIDGKIVYFADICLEPDRMIEIANRAKKVIVLDHHKTAADNAEKLVHPNLECHFDMTHSGASLAWQHNFPDKEIPCLIRYIEDRDLYNRELPHHDNILYAIDSYEMKFETWDLIMMTLDTPDGFEMMQAGGENISRYVDTLVNRLAAENFILNIRGYEVPAVNISFFKNEVLHKLLIKLGCPFAAAFSYVGDGFRFSLRSIKTGPESTDVSFDVEKIAHSFPGGGGHPGSSGFFVKSLKDLT